MPVQPLPSNPSLDHLKYQAKDLLKGHAVRSLQVAQRIREFHPRFKAILDAEIFAASFPLSDAQLTIAREYGFPSWTALKASVKKPAFSAQRNLPHHERIEDPKFRHAVRLLDAGDASGLHAHLKQYPHLTGQRVVFEGANYFRNPTLLEFVAENPIRHGTLPANILAIAEVILNAGGRSNHSALNDTLGLVSSGCVPRECRVQLPLIGLLCDYGAEPTTALQAALVHGEFEAANALFERGAQIDLSAAAALGRTEKFLSLLPASSSEDRHRALAFASQFGHLAIVRALLDAGEDPDRYNPTGLHSHSTPMHQAAFAGHDPVVRLLIQRGARLDMPDIMWNGTPADWAQHAGKTELETYLRSQKGSKPQT